MAGGIAGAGVGPGGARWVRWLGVRLGTGAHTGTVVGLLVWKAATQKGRQKTGMATLSPATTPTPHPVRRMPPPNLLSKKRDRKRGTEGKRDADGEKQH